MARPIDPGNYGIDTAHSHNCRFAIRHLQQSLGSVRMFDRYNGSVSVRRRPRRTVVAIDAERTASLNSGT